MTIIVDRNLYLDRDRNLVEDGDPKAAFLWHIAGDEITDEEAEEVGYKDGTVKPDENDQPDVKIGDVADNKAVEAPAEDKAAPVKKAAKRTRKAAKKAT